jgi:hypothetical protein
MDDDGRSAAIFNEMGKVLQHPRCLNCHPVDGMPRQGDDLALHQPPVVRGSAGGMGAPGMRCVACHGVENVEYVGAEGAIPGHDPWHLAPLLMGWTGLSRPQICDQIKDPARNGGKTLAKIQTHNAKDDLVGWGWAPGKERAHQRR